MSDHELLELAAKANGLLVKGWVGNRLVFFNPITESAEETWNPLTDDGDALRLAVKLNIELHLDLTVGSVITAFMVGAVGRNTFEEVDDAQGNPYIATRRAIVRAAANIGESLS